MIKHLFNKMRRLALPLMAAICSPACAQAQTTNLPIQAGIASYNIHHGEGTDGKYDFERLANQFNHWQADVIALQEVDSMTTRSGKTYALGTLADITRYYDTFCPTMDYQGGKYGIGMLSRQKPLKVTSYALPGKEEPRRLMVAEFKDYVVACTHLSLNADDRMTSLPIILQAARNTDKPFVIAGDWNDTPNSPFIKALSKDFCLRSNTRLATFPADSPKDCIDYIAVYKRSGEPNYSRSYCYVNEPAVVTTATVGSSKTASDHRPIFAKMIFPTPVEKLMTTKPYLQLSTPTSVNVMFQTNSVSHCWVEFGTDTFHTQRARTLLYGQEVCYGIENNIQLKNLQPGTRYFYRVCATEILLKQAYATHFAGDTLRTPFYSFQTPDTKDNGDFVCAIFNDLHESKETYDALLQLMENEGINPNFVIFNGDCLPEPTNREHALHMIHALADPINGAERPIIFLRGNHEIRNCYSAGMHHQIGYYNDKTYSAFTRGNTRFVLLDCGEDKPDDSDVYAGLNDFTQLRLDQVDFLKQELKSKNFKQAKHRVLISHIPVFGNTDKYRPCLDLWGPLLKKAPFDVAIGAHTHQAAFHPEGTNGCQYPVYIGGGPSAKNATVSILTLKNGKLSMRVLSNNPKSRWTLDMK